MSLKSYHWAVGVLLILGTLGGVSLYQTLRFDLLRNDSEGTKAAVLQRIPIGSEIPVAKAVMESEGFSCTKLHNTKFAEDRPERGPQLVHPKADILWCDSGERGFLVTKRWQVSFVDSEGLVSNVAVSVGLTGP